MGIGACLSEDHRLLSSRKIEKKKMAAIFKLLLLSVCMLFGNAEVITHNTAGTVAASFEVHCTDTEMTVYFDKDQLDGRTLNDGTNNRTYSIMWYNQDSDRNCRVYRTDLANVELTSTSASAFTNAINIKATLPTGCGVNEIYDDYHIMYNQTVVVTYGSNPNNYVRREEYDYYNVMCMRNRTVEEKLGGVGHFNTSLRQQGTDAKNTTLDYVFTFVQYDNQGLAQSEYQLGEFIQFTIMFNTSLTSTKAVVQKCWTTSDGSNMEYNLIKDRCADDVGSRILHQSDKKFSWQTEAFRYLGASTSQIYAECLVRICVDTDTTAECTHCTSIRKRRAIEDDSVEQTSPGEMVVLRSPKFYILDNQATPTNSQAAASNNVLSGTTGTILIVLLATLILIVALAVIKKVFFPTPVPQVAAVTMKGIDNQGLA